MSNTAGGFVDADAPLMEAGVDSLGAVELRNQLQSMAGNSDSQSSSLPSTLVFDHPTARGLAAFLAPPAEEEEAPSPDLRACARMSAGDVRLAAVDAILPGGASGLVRAWRLAMTGLDVFVQSPAARWDTHEVSSGIRRPPTHAAFMHDAALFDPAAFRISDPETATMDPQQRVVLELGYRALHEAKLPRASLLESGTGVYVGVMSIEFREAQPLSNAYDMSSTGHCFVAGRLSFVFGLHGACEAVDVACSSALVACHNANRALQTREVVDALAAGVNMFFLPAVLESYAAGGLTSASGRAYVFDARANGFVRGEGCSVGVMRVGKGGGRRRRRRRLPGRRMGWQQQQDSCAAIAQGSSAALRCTRTADRRASRRPTAGPSTCCWTPS